MADEDDKKRIARKVTLINNDVGPRYANTLRGQETVLVGQSIDTECNGYQLDSLRTEYIHGTEDAPRWSIENLEGDFQEAGDRGEALEGLPVAKLRAIAEAENVALTERKDSATGENLPDLKTGKEIAAAILAHREANPA